MHGCYLHQEQHDRNDSMATTKSHSIPVLWYLQPYGHDGNPHLQFFVSKLHFNAMHRHCHGHWASEGLPTAMARLSQQLQATKTTLSQW